MLWVGLTGGIGSGKSTVAELLRQKSYAVIDADLIVHQLLQDRQSLAYQNVLKDFGPDILDAQQNIDRRKLGQLVFNKPDKLLHLESILHPMVQTEVKKQRDQLIQKKSIMAFYDVPLLYEKKLQAQFDYVLLVHSTEAQQIERVMKRSSLAHEQVLGRLQQQMPIDLKKSMADFVIDNTGTLSDLNKQVDQALDWLQKKI